MAEYDGTGRRPIGRGWIVLGIVAVLLLLAAVIPSPFAIERPGPVVDAFGEYPGLDGEAAQVIRIDGVETYPADGALNVLSVTVQGTPEDPVSWLALSGTLFDPTRTAVPLGDRTSTIGCTTLPLRCPPGRSGPARAFGAARVALLAEEVSGRSAPQQVASAAARAST